ncbi:phospholipid carrier-dependent glycosyltransferase [Tautonia plasticadhaerens]|uniref:Dolichyl-phosphate-mannose-protein mannosyltransferase n=1 Tax=Tautonia plasticadhaerens TaxID=2527974 RepID=A0A518GW15_9BACT|nr:phospholipid carrier-dependent glycosyltransferase [Tautonia plasticadhaerens]QDV32758.1 Dolichyl-phosphate-mannose-protein mannosyltransferase [Tautonia plasticadhaerens]
MVPLLWGPPGDPDNYLVLARSLAEGRGLRGFDGPTAYRPPLYPIALAPGVALLGDTPTAWVALLHLSLGGATVALTGLAARRWGLPARSGLLAMVVVAFDPVLVAQSRGVMTETMAAALVAGLLAASTPAPTVASASILGVVGGLASLCRPSLLPAAILIALVMAVGSPGGRRARVARSSAMLAALVASMAPWAIRNTVALGEPIWTTTHGGYTLLLANNPAYYDDVLDGPMDVWSGANQRRWFEEVGRRGAGLPEPEADRMFRREAIRVIADRPGDFARATLARLGRFWAIAPSAAVYPGSLRIASAAWTAPLWALLVVGLMRGGTWRWPRSSATAVVIALTVIHCVYWTDLRMRAPIVPAIALVAAGAFRPGHTPRPAP